MRYTDPHDVEYIASVLAAADKGYDCWDDLRAAYAHYRYLTMADAVLRAIEIREVME